MAWLRGEIAKVVVAVGRARTWILAIALTHILAVVVGAVLVHTGNPYALEFRDRLVGQAQAADPVSLAYQRGDNLRAALIEMARTEGICAAVGVTGLTIVPPFVLAAYRGWVGGVVSVDGSHASRLVHLGQASYYLVTVILQIIPYVMAAGGGIRLGMTYFRGGSQYQGDRWLGYPKEAIWDFARILVLITPFVALANLWEFLSPLNR